MTPEEWEELRVKIMEQAKTGIDWWALTRDRIPARDLTSCLDSMELQMMGIKP